MAFFWFDYFSFKIFLLNNIEKCPNFSKKFIFIREKKIRFRYFGFRCFKFRNLDILSQVLLSLNYRFRLLFINCISLINRKMSEWKIMFLKIKITSVTINSLFAFIAIIKIFILISSSLFKKHFPNTFANLVIISVIIRIRILWYDFYDKNIS